MSSVEPIHVLLAFDAFKGTLSASRAGEAAEQGILNFQLQGEDGMADTSSPAVDSPDSKDDADAVEPFALQRDALLQFHHCPMSDGGSGLLDCLVSDSGGHGYRRGSSSSSGGFCWKRVVVPTEVNIIGPLGDVISGGTTGGGYATKPVSFVCDISRGIIVIEMAEAAGLPRIASAAQRNPLRATSFGVGQVLAYALSYMDEEYARVEGSEPTEGRTVTVFLGIGGSATNDGGLGALQALGLELYVRTEEASSLSVKDDCILTSPLQGRDLARLTRVRIGQAIIDRFFSSAASSRVAVGAMYLISDVTSPLVGPHGATYVFGPQKCAPAADGASCVAEGALKESDDGAVGVITSAEQQAMLDELERGISHAASVVVASTAQWMRAARQRRHGLRDGLDAFTANEDLVAHFEEELLHGEGGGAGGGMSGFFRYVLCALWLPGAEVVAALVGLHVKPELLPFVQSDWEHLRDACLSTGALRPCDVLITGEGSFDFQTVSHRKTVGRLLQMVAETNFERLHEAVVTAHSGPPHTLLQASSTLPPLPFADVPVKLIREVLVVCGKCGFASPEVGQLAIAQELCREMLRKARSGKAESEILLQRQLRELIGVPVDSNSTTTVVDGVLERIFRLAVPRVTLLPLSPEPFSVHKAMHEPFACIAQRVASFLSHYPHRGV